jgi:hypothetical protein
MQPAKTFNYNESLGHGDRKGLGYGQVKDRFHKPRQSGSDFPYKTDDYEGENFEDEETEEAIAVKVPTVYATDFGAAAGTDPFYFAAGNVKLSDAFFRVGPLIEAMVTFSDSMTPAPHAYKTRKKSLGRGTGSSFPSGVGSYKRTGSRRGFSSAPPLPKVAAVSDYEDEIESEDEIFTLADLARKVTLGE